MTKRQVAKQNMFLGLLILINSYSLVWQVLVAFVNSFDLFKKRITDLNDAVERQEQLKAGYTLQKRSKLIAMADAAYTIKSAIQAWASDQKDDGIFGSVDYSKSELIYGSSVKCRDNCKKIYNVAMTNAVSIKTYGVLQPQIDALNVLVNAFTDVISKPKNMKGEEKEAGKLVKKLILEIDDIIVNKLTKLMENFRTTAPIFYNQFFADKKIYHAKTNFTGIRATIVNKATGKMLEGVKMIAQGTDANYEVLSNTAGVADAKQISPELYSLTFVIPGFESVTKPNVKAQVGKKTSLIIEMSPSTN